GGSPRPWSVPLRWSRAGRACHRNRVRARGGSLPKFYSVSLPRAPRDGGDPGRTRGTTAVGGAPRQTSDRQKECSGPGKVPCPTSAAYCVAARRSSSPTCPNFLTNFAVLPLV